MAKIPALTSWTNGDTYNPWHPPGASEGMVQLVRDEAGGYVGPQLSPGTTQEVVITREHAASGPRNVVFPWFLPYFDATTMHESAVMRMAYRQMMADPRIKTAVLGKLFGIAALGLKILPADKKNTRDKAIAKHVEWMLTERLKGTVPGLVWSILVSALIDGYSVSEKVWTLEERGRYSGKYSLKALKPKDTNNDLVLQTDEYRNVIGVLGLRYNGGQVFSPARFLIYQHLPLFDNPTGMSDLRAAYQSYWMLDTVTKLRAVASEKYAIPLLYGTYQSSTVKASLEGALKLAKSQRWFAVPEQCRVQALEMAGSSEEHFKSFIMDLRHDIFLSIQGAVLQTLEGETTDARGNSQVHASTSDKFVWFLANSVESCLNDRDSGLIKDCVDLNYVADEYPKAALSSVDVNELSQEIQIDLGLKQLGWIHSIDELAERYGRNVPEDDDDKLQPPEQAAGGAAGGTPGASAPEPPGPPGPPGGNGQGGELPFMEQDMFTPRSRPLREAAARPFQGERFSEAWRDYLRHGQYRPGRERWQESRRLAPLSRPPGNGALGYHNGQSH